MKLFRIACAVIGLSLSACASTPNAGSALDIDRSHVSAAQDSRVQFLVIHYTWGDFDSSFKILMGGPVSSHYLVRDKPAKVFQLVDEERRSFHAGVSSWQGNTQLNASSIGIEIVNAGGRPDANGVLQYADYEAEQIELVIKLVQDIVKRHKIRPDRVVGHSDIAPTRKTDPGPKFPWKRLADLGLVLWPNAADVSAALPQYEAQLPDVAWFQKKLKQHGFELPQNGELDKGTRDAVSAFQMKYRPERYDGMPDAQTAALLDVLTTKK
jgi:N-acetylmuramoyl-L-alanine amidase